MRIKWRLATWCGREYATCCGRRFQCITKEVYKKSGDIVATWMWIPEIDRYVNNYGR